MAGWELAGNQPGQRRKQTVLGWEPTDEMRTDNGDDDDDDDDDDDIDDDKATRLCGIATSTDDILCSI